MPYSATSYRLLISAPSDISDDDREVVNRTVNRWNAIFGEQLGAVVVPIHWRLHAAAEHGNRPQAALNEQLVHSADVVVALFWHRLGSPTGAAASGTVEEIDEAHQRSVPVSILHCTRPIPYDVDPQQWNALRSYLDDIKQRSLVLEYADEAELANRVEAILMRVVSRAGARAEAAVEQARAGGNVTARVVHDERMRTDSRGNVRADREWRLVLANVGTEPARNVRHRLETERAGEDLPWTQNEDRELPVLAPGVEASYHLLMHMGVAPQARCVVSWEDSTGEREYETTLRFF